MPTIFAKKNNMEVDELSNSVMAFHEQNSIHS